MAKQNQQPTTANRSTDKREAILEAALELFADRGFYGTAVPEIARKAVVGAGTIYRYFKSKEELVNVLYQQWKGRLVESAARDFPFDAPPRQQFRAYWHRVATFVRDHPCAFSFLELHHHAPYLDAQSAGIEERLMQLVHAFLEQTRHQQVTKPISSELIIALVHGAFVGMVKAWREGRIELDQETIDQMESCCWEAIRA